MASLHAKSQVVDLQITHTILEEAELLNCLFYLNPNAESNYVYIKLANSLTLKFMTQFTEKPESSGAR